LDSYALAFGILGGGGLLAAVLWFIPRLRRRMTVRHFRKALDHVDLVTLAWSQGLHYGEADDLSTTPPEGRRSRKRGDEQPDEGGATLF
jgi:hypothetical protein